MPKPHTGEDREEFLNRCMGDAEALADFPRNDQRYAYCVSTWEDKEDWPEDDLEEKADYVPTSEMAAEAKRGLDWRREFNRGGTAIGVARARDISNRRSLSLSTVKRMVSYFARHEVDKQGQGWAPGSDGYPSAGRIAWALWGGDAGRSWANKIAKEAESKMNEEFSTKHVSFQLETKELGKDGQFTGYASIYSNVDHGGDVIEPGAFARALDPSRPKPKMLWQHDPNEVIGVWETIQDDSKGLRMTGRLLTQIQRASEAYTLLQAGAIDGLSIGYRALEFDFIPTERGTVRQLKALDLFEVSLVTFPMNPKALVTDVKQLQSPREVETILRNSGVPSSFAKLVAIHGFDEAKSRLALDQRDAGKRDDRVQAGFGRLLSEIQSLKESMKNG